MSRSAERVQGGCLCGQVRFEVERDYITYRYCFCSRCRKARGSSHAANIFVAPDEFRWTAGEELVKRWDLEGHRFGNCFCASCGSPVPRLTTGAQSFLIPAGALDSHPGILPQGAIFWDSRAAWLPTPDDLEKFSEYE